jgi:hypothetical protein
MRFQLQDSDYHSHRPVFTVKVETDWNGAFAAVGPSLLNEAHEDAMRDKLDTWAVSLAFDRAENEKDEWVREQRLRGVTGGFNRGNINSRDFETILLQLRALGLIAMSDRKRSVNDTGTYWTLTPYGDDQLVGLRALRRGQPASQADAANASEAGEPNDADD